MSSAEDFELARVRERHRAWDITREGIGRYVARDGYGREVPARSAAERQGLVLA